MFKRLVTFLTIIMISAMAVATAQTSFTTVQPRTVIAGNKFNVTFRLKNGQGSGLKAPEIKGCTLLYGPSTSTMQNYQWVNGKSSTTTTVDYSFTYRADTPGTYVIGEAQINVDGKTLTTKPVNFTVLPPDKASQSQQNGTRLDDTDTQQAGKPIGANDVFVRIILNKSKAYEQEAIVCTIKLYTKYSISSFLATTQPAFDGFIAEEVNLQPQLNEVEHYNGQNYMTAVLKQCVLFPQKSGKLTINSGKYDVTIVQHERVGGFWGGTRPIERDIKVSSNSVSVAVNPLPQPQPEGFTGAVGSFSIDSRLTANTFKTNEAASLIYTITGTGNIKSIKEPTIDFPEEFDQYTPQTEVDTHVAGQNVTGTMTIDYTFVPESVGTFTIGEDTFVYFNPATGKYVTLTTSPYSIKVAQGMTSSASTVSKQSITSKNTDILHIKMGNLDLSKTHTQILNTWWYVPSYLLLAVIFIVIVAIYRKQVKLNADVQGRRLAHAGKVAKKRLKLAKTYMLAHDNDHFYEETLRALWGYLGDKLGMAASQLSRDNIAQQLDAAGASATLTQRIIAIIDECEMARYSPAQSDEQVEHLFDEASAVMNDMENLKRAKLS